ncbi:MAG: TonB-dependent receptor, partial [Acidobacteria bacterium]|nr:TonB-dependent receptor [Acidobacteriota bacterium]
TVNQRLIENLPINGRNYINFTLTASQAQRDSAPSIGAAPTSGLNFQGQRARSNQVSVDGADAVDNSTNGIRSTVSQEAVQEFQLIMSNYMPEFGRATGGVINIVTKGGTNTVHGNVFGFLRHSSIQARNPFSVQVDPVTGEVKAVKQTYTRVQAGATLGGPIRKDKTFYFVAYETTRRQETGFTNIGANNFGLVPATTPAVPGVTLLLTPAQRDFVNSPAVLGAPGGAQAAATLFALAGSGSSVGLTGIDPGLVANFRGVPATPGKRFPIPIDCQPPGVPCSGSNLVPLPSSFVPLRVLIGNYPISEGTGFYSARLDHQWNERHNSFVRVNVSPSKATGIQVNAQNQNFGQNAGSRTSIQQSRDFALVAQHFSTIGTSAFQEMRFQFARRGMHYGYSELPGGSQVAVNITGFAFFGREPFSTVDRIERRYQWTDGISWSLGRHNLKAGADVNIIQLRSNKEQIFELNFGGIFNFGGLTASQVGLPTAVGGVPVPSIIAPQAYGLGLPQVFIQGIGNSNMPFNNYPLAFFIQDSWRIHPRLTLNYGVRYDIELTQKFEAATALNRAAEAAFNVVEGIPTDKNNVAPRFALAWDPRGNGNTVIRAGYGLFYDHPLLAVAFNATTAEGALSTQLLSGGGTATRLAAAVNPIAAMNAASIFQGVLNQGPLPLGYLPNEQRFDSKLPESLFANQKFLTAGVPLPLLPFTLPVAGDFKFGYAQQANLTVEQKIASDYRISVAYTYTHGVKLHRPRNINTTDPVLLSANYRNALAAGLSASSPIAVSAPAADVAATPGACGVLVSGAPGTAPGILGRLNGCPAPLSALDGQPVGTAAFFNFFRPSGPNPSFAALVPGGYPTQVALAKAAGYPTGFPGVPVAWSDVMQQESSGNSLYHGMTLGLSKRFSRRFEFTSSYTWSHAIDDSTDLQTLLSPQNNRRPDLERSNSTFDQRHRWVTSAVFESPYRRSSRGWHRKLLADFVFSPIIEFASGRPYTVLTGSDFNLDFGSNTDRPSAGTAGVSTPFIKDVSFTVPTACDQKVQLGTTSISPPFGCYGDVGRNSFTKPGFTMVDLRVARRFPISDRANLEFIADMFNVLNRFNVGDVSPLCNPLDPASCRAGEPTAALDPRQFQFALKLSW